MSNRPVPSVALLPWGDLFEDDFLDTIGVSLDSFLKEVDGGWGFGYISALQMSGVRVTMILFSARVNSPLHFTHSPTGAHVCVLPVPYLYRIIRRRMINRNGQSLEEVFGDVPRVSRPFFAALAALLPYLATPLGTLARELRRDGCDVILCQEYEYPRFDMCVLLGKLMRLPVFATFQGGGERLLTPVEQMLRPRSIQASTGLIIATRSEAKRLRLRYSVPSAKLAHIFNPVDLRVWNAAGRTEARAALGIPTDARVAVWHGRVEIGQKGLDILLDAWQQICQERPGRDLRLLLVGSGSDAARLRALLETTQAPGVRWIDRYVRDRAELQQYLSAADVYAFPSRAEGFPVAPIEGMACGLPIVASDAHGIPDILQGGEADGGLIVPGNHATAFALALGRLLDDGASRQRLGARARRRVEEYFSLPAVGSQLRSFLFGQAGSRDSGRHVVLHHFEENGDRTEAPLRLTSLSPARAPLNPGFNVQPNGYSALALAAENADRGTLVALDNDLLVTSYGTSTYLTALVPKKVLKKPGRHAVYLTDGRRQSNRIDFIVEGASPVLGGTNVARGGNRTSCRNGSVVLRDLLPRSVQVGRRFNVQADGQSAICVQCENATPETSVVFGDTPLATTFGSPELLTALVPATLYSRPVAYRVYLRNRFSTSNRLEFIVEA